MAPEHGQVYRRKQLARLEEIFILFSEEILEMTYSMKMIYFSWKLPRPFVRRFQAPPLQRIAPFSFSRIFFFEFAESSIHFRVWYWYIRNDVNVSMQVWSMALEGRCILTFKIGPDIQNFPC